MPGVLNLENLLRTAPGQLQNKRKLQQEPAVGPAPRPLNTSSSPPGAPPTPEEAAAPIKAQTPQAMSGHEAPQLPRLAPACRRPGRRIKQPLRLSEVSPKSPSPLHAILDPEQGSTKTKKNIIGINHPSRHIIQGRSTLGPSCHGAELPGNRGSGKQASEEEGRLESAFQLPLANWNPC